MGNLRYDRRTHVLASRLLSAPAVFLAVLLGLAVGPEACATPPAERWLPTNTVAFVTVPNAQAAREAWRLQSPGRLWSDPAMAPFRAHTESEATRLFWEPLARLTGFPAASLAGLAGGQVTVALVDESDPKGAFLELKPVLLIDSADKAPELDAWFARRNPAIPATSVLLQGVEFQRIALAKEVLEEALQGILPEIEGEPAAPRAPAVSHAVLVGRKDAVLLASTSSNALSYVLQQLAESPVPSGASNSLPGGPLVHGVLKVPPFLRSLSPTPLTLGGFASPDGGPSVARLATALGLHQLRHVAFSIRSSPEGWYADVRLAVPPNARTGLFGLLPLAPLDSAPPPFIPADALEFARARFSGPAAWTGLEKMVRDIDPAFLGVLQLFTGYAGKTEDADFDFQKGIIDLLGDDWISAVVPTRNPGTTAPLFVVGSPKAPELFRGLHLVASPTYLATFFPPESLAPQRADLRLEGQTVTSVAWPAMPWAGGSTGAVHFVQRQGYVAFSTDLGVLARLLTTNTPAGLAQRPDLRQGAARSGGTAGGYFSYSDEKTAAAGFFTAFSRSSHALSEHAPWIAVSPTATRLVAGIEAWIDPERIPPFEKVARHFGLRITSGRITPEGYEFTTFRPDPASPPP